VTALAAAVWVALMVALLLGAWLCWPPRWAHLPRWLVIDADENPGLAAAEDEADEARLRARRGDAPYDIEQVMAADLVAELEQWRRTKR
jgi:hypothetical protein